MMIDAVERGMNSEMAKCEEWGRARNLPPFHGRGRRVFAVHSYDSSLLITE